MKRNAQFTLLTSRPFAVRKAFKRRALETHPDKVSPQPLNEQEKEDAEKQFHEVRNFDCLLSETPDIVVIKGLPGFRSSQ